MIRIRPSRPTDVPAMFEIWREAVRATHGFLTEEDIRFYAVQVRDHYLPSCPFWVATTEGDEPKGFMGMTGAKIDALFVHPSEHGKGIGRVLVAHAASLAGELTVDVNEQNAGACSFYGRLGFRQTGRSELDGSGKPFPILHLARASATT
ncbi:acetyltransferase [Microvirga lenta]|uniref:acetyltransferase n=1 Tax=Microvirga lenta TaxID=2881337 RepID=UPI001CFFA194|nr:acetyltransferase [Microvirga lenta]MCB5176748.1 acetyltransferase [Microvirga lenta]